MTPQIPVDLTKVKTRCEKAKCKTHDWVLHRHHRGAQSLFVHQFVWRFHQPKYIEFVKRYYRYEEEDICRVCASHHREIHDKYDAIIRSYSNKFHKPLRDFTWPQAEKLMGALIARCNKWLTQQTPGSDTPWPSNGRTKNNAAEFLALITNAEPDDDELGPLSLPSLPF